MHKGKAMMKHDCEEHQHLINISQEPFMELLLTLMQTQASNSGSQITDIPTTFQSRSAT